MSAPSRIYLLTPALAEAELEPFLQTLTQALDAAPVACLRIRTAGEDEALLRRAVDMIRPLAHDRDIAVTITNHFRLASALGADGVHLTDPRISVRDARKHLGEDAVVGMFAGASRHDGMVAAEAGADYVALGPVQDQGLGDGAIADRELFAWWAEMIECPVVAEGGVDATNAGDLASQADYLAFDKAVWTAEEGVVAAMRQFSAMLVEAQD